MIWLTIIIISFGRDHFTSSCLDSLVPIPDGVRIIVVKNDSDFFPKDIPEELHGRVCVLEAHRNLGFAAANNLAVKQTCSEILLLLNNDTTVEEMDWESVRRYFSENPRVGIVGTRVLNADGTLQPSARRYPDFFTGLFGRTSFLSRFLPNNPWSRQQLQSDILQLDKASVVDWVSGACMFIRNETFEQLGGLSEAYFMYWEDADFCYRARMKGWVTVYLPVGHVIHYGGGSSNATLGTRVRTLFHFHRSAYTYFVLNISHSAIHPMNLVAAIGLGCRLIIKLVSSTVRGFVDRGRGSLAPERHPQGD